MAGCRSQCVYSTDPGGSGGAGSGSGGGTGVHVSGGGSVGAWRSHSLCCWSWWWRLVDWHSWLIYSTPRPSCSSSSGWVTGRASHKLTQYISTQHIPATMRLHVCWRRVCKSTRVVVECGRRWRCGALLKDVVTGQWICISGDVVWWRSSRCGRWVDAWLEWCRVARHDWRRQRSDGVMHLTTAAAAAALPQQTAA